MASTPLINGRRFSFSSLEIVTNVVGKPVEIFTDVDDISYSEALEVAFKRGTSRGPIGWTGGVYTPGDASLQMGKSSFQQLIESIGPGWLGINLGLTVIYSDIGEPLVTDELIARITGIEDAHSYSADALVSKVTLLPFTIVRNGIIPLFNRVF